MPIDGQKLNQIYNQLKELAGEGGAFILFCAAGGGSESDEDTQIRTFGPQTRQIGILDTCVPFIRERQMKVFQSRMKQLPQEPD